MTALAAQHADDAAPARATAAAGGRRPLRVLRLCSVFEPPAGVPPDPAFDPVGGMQCHTVQLTRHLDALGVRQDVVTAWRPGARRVERLGGRARVMRLGVPTRRLRQLYAVPAARLVPRLARAADLVHAHLGEDLALVPLALWAAGRAGRPVVLTVHTSPRHTVRATGPRELVLRAAGGRLEAAGERRAAAVVVLASGMAGRLRADGVPAARLHVIPSGVDPRRFAARRPDPHPAAGRPRVLYVGRLARQKGVGTLLLGAARMRSPARVVLVGDGPERARLERLARRLGVAGRVSFAGFASPREVVAHMQHADMLVLPSVYEELGSVLLEGLQAGLPIVASAVGGIPEVVEDGVNGRLVPARDPAALAAAMDAVLGDPALARAMGAASAARAAAFHWPALAERILALYRSVAAGLPPAGPPGARATPGRRAPREPTGAA